MVLDMKAPIPRHFTRTWNVYFALFGRWETLHYCSVPKLHMYEARLRRFRFDACADVTYFASFTRLTICIPAKCRSNTHNALSMECCPCFPNYARLKSLSFTRVHTHCSLPYTRTRTKHASLGWPFSGGIEYAVLCSGPQALERDALVFCRARHRALGHDVTQAQVGWAYLSCVSVSHAHQSHVAIT